MRRPSRRSRRDTPSRALLDSLLKTWTETGDREVGVVAADALREARYVAAADDLDQAIRAYAWARTSRPGILKRKDLLKRIYAEVNGGKVLTRGEWSANYPNSKRFYVAIFEEPQARVTLWERREDSGNWNLWGTYWLREYDGDMRELMHVLGSDLRYESLPLGVRAAERKQRARILMSLKNARRRS